MRRGVVDSGLETDCTLVAHEAVEEAGLAAAAGAEEDDFRKVVIHAAELLIAL